MRILLFSGKGGVGKTSIAAATGVHLARLGKKTLILSVDPAHSLADAFDLGGALFHGNTADPLPISERLWVQEVNINHELKLHWKEISTYVSSVLRTSGIQGVEAEEMAIFPGMEELSAMMYINSLRKSDYDVIVLDCAPTAESLALSVLPTTLGWYMKHIFRLPTKHAESPAPVGQARIAPVELPPDSYFRNIQDLFHKVEGMDKVLEDATMTSVRLVTNPKKWCFTRRSAPSFTSRCTGSLSTPSLRTACCRWKPKAHSSKAGGGPGRRSSRKSSSIFLQSPSAKFRFFRGKY